MSTPPGTSSRGPPAQTPRAGGRQQRSNTPSNTGGSIFRTPSTATRAFFGGGGTSRRTPATANQTPHARAARLALDSRRTAIFTPGGRQSRRKSGRMLRDSPRELLRNLSRRLAPASRPAVSSSSPGSSSSGAKRGRRNRGPVPDVDIDIDREAATANNVRSASRRRTYQSILDDDDDDSLPLDRPRMSLNIDEDDNDDDLRPHRSMILENGSDDDDMDADADLANLTTRSIELARRAATQEQLLQARRFSRGSLGARSSFGSMRMSDYIDEFGRVDAGINAEDSLDRLQRQSAFFPEGAFDNLLPSAEDGTGIDLTFERLDSDTGAQGPDEARQAAEMGESGLGAVDLGLDGGNETTFMLNTQPSPDRALAPVLVDDDGPVDMDEMGEIGAALGSNDNRKSLWVDDFANESLSDPDDPGEIETVTNDATASNHAKALPVKLLRNGQETAPTGRGSAQKRLKLSAHGIAYPSLPAGVVKRIAQTFASSGSSGAGKSRTKLGPETVAALSTASDWFFEQASIDLQRYAKHAGRKTIDESDVMLLMRRQRQVNGSVTAFSLAQRMMPRELLQELRMIPDTPAPKRRPQQSKERGPLRPKRIRKQAESDVT
ncbi:hypothetical protein SEPCBS119000_002281 [Sporothrix epigloea]|uniref:CENP-T/Histone H4 histone fold domain-containing protein n=1 Tax=Sporothrix epigloea TaxID=1892477 RepID=A0ABP0DFA5_9PEZI